MTRKLNKKQRKRRAKRIVVHAKRDANNESIASASRLRGIHLSTRTSQYIILAHGIYSSRHAQIASAVRMRHAAECDVREKRVYNIHERERRLRRDQWARATVFRVHIFRDRASKFKKWRSQIFSDTVVSSIIVDAIILRFLGGRRVNQNQKQRFMCIIAQFVTATQLRMLRAMSCTVPVFSFPAAVQHDSDRIRGSVVKVAAVAALKYTMNLLFADVKLFQFLEGHGGTGWLFPCSTSSLNIYFANIFNN